LLSLTNSFNGDFAEELLLSMIKSPATKNLSIESDRHKIIEFCIDILTKEEKLP